MSRIAAWIPRPDVTSVHAVEIAASPESVYDALGSTDFSRHPIVATLMFLRGLPAIIASPRATWWRLRRRGGRTRLPLKALLGDDFVLLEEQPFEEIVLGLTGRFWTPTGGLVPTDASTFRDTVPAGLARAAWCFRLEPLAPSRTRLSTETRVCCADAATRRAFLRYWRIIAPASGLIRVAILRMVRRRAESTAAS
jgi:hypothetical protein